MCLLCSEEQHLKFGKSIHCTFSKANIINLIHLLTNLVISNLSKNVYSVSVIYSSSIIEKLLFFN